MRKHIGIVGPACSGKTVLANALKFALETAPPFEAVKKKDERGRCTGKFDVKVVIMDDFNLNPFTRDRMGISADYVIVTAQSMERLLEIARAGDWRYAQIITTEFEPAQQQAVVCVDGGSVPTDTNGDGDVCMYGLAIPVVLAKELGRLSTVACTQLINTWSQLKDEATAMKRTARHVRELEDELKTRTAQCEELGRLLTQLSMESCKIPKSKHMHDSLRLVLGELGVHDWPCHLKPHNQWCDRKGSGDFMGHTCKRNVPIPPAGLKFPAVKNK